MLTGAVAPLVDFLEKRRTLGGSVIRTCAVGTKKGRVGRKDAWFDDAECVSQAAMAIA
jgi:hypothetical protein